MSGAGESEVEVWAMIGKSGREAAIQSSERWPLGGESAIVIGATESSAEPVTPVWAGGPTRAKNFPAQR